MTPVRWPLAILLELAAREEAGAAAALAEALAAEGTAARERDLAGGALREHRAAASARARRAPGPGAAAGSLSGWARHLARLGADGARLEAALVRREARHAGALAEVTRRREALAAARAAVRALEEGREAWRAARRRERDRAEEDEAGDAWSSNAPRAAAS